jgi:transcriptional regulator GlxA family with amidase domain
MDFGILLFPDVEELDFIGPWEMLQIWNRHVQGPHRGLLIAEKREAITCAKGLTVLPDSDFDHAPPLDVLLVPGGQGTREQVENPRLIEFIAERAAHAKDVLSVCTGAFLLQKAGLLAGKRATTHWQSLDRLRAFDEVTVVEERIVHDGGIWTSAGVSAGIDLLLAYIAATAGEEAASRVQFGAEYFPSRKKYGDPGSRTGIPAYLKREIQKPKAASRI